MGLSQPDTYIIQHIYGSVSTLFMGLFQPYQNSNIYNPRVSFNPKQETIQNQILFNNNNN